MSYSFYIKHIKEKLIESNFTGNLIIDYPYNIDWLDKYSGIHYKSYSIKKCQLQEKTLYIIFSVMSQSQRHTTL